MTVAEVDALLASLVPAPSGETVALEAAVGRVLAAPLVADRDGPPFHRVAMDGYAVASADGPGPWRVWGLQLAGHPPLTLQPGTAVEVATGAPLPQGCDAVVPYEATVREDCPEGALVRLAEGPSARPPEVGRHVHHRASDFHRGQELLAAGTALRSPHLHSLATCGVEAVAVVRRARWALVATGDELVGPGEAPLDWQIRRSNGPAIAGEARSWGLVPDAQRVLPDDADALATGLADLVAHLDVVVVTGGVSAGARDLVPSVLGSLGVTTLFHKVAQRPGKPLWCGRSPSGALVFGLPGNPVSSLFSFRRYVLPWLLAFEGRRAPSRPLTPRPEGLEAPEGQTVFVPWSAEGPLGWKGSGDFAALGASTGFVEVGDHTHPIYHPWGGEP